MNKHVYGINLEDCEDQYAYSIADMSQEERFKRFVENPKDSLEVYGVEEFFTLLNTDCIDTENKLWFIA